MKISIRILGLISVSLIALVLSACTKDSAKNESAGKVVRALVETYCKADFDGAMLSTANYNKSPLRQFVVEGEEEGPAWDTATLIKTYSTKSIEVKGEKASVTVLYEVLGEVPGAQEVEVKKRNESYTFMLIEQKGNWKLIRPTDLMPHIGVDTAIHHIQGLHKIEKNSQPHAPKVIEHLKELKLAS